MMRVHVLLLGFFFMQVTRLLSALWNRKHQEGQFKRQSPFYFGSTTSTLIFWGACYGMSLFLLLAYGIILESILKRKLLSRKIHTSAHSTKLSALLILSSLHSAASVPASVITGPMSMNTTLCATNITLTCVVEAENLIFVINNKNADEGVPGFDQSGVVTNGSFRTRHLNVEVSLDISGSSIICRGFNLLVDPSQDSSDPAVILVQGPLDPPTMAMYSIINRSTLYISWTPPPTLPGTTIRRFHVSSSTGDSIFTHENFVILNIFNSDPDSCSSINITIIPDNCIDGEATVLSGIYLPSLPSSIQEILVHYRPIQRVLNETKRRILLEVNVGILCPSEIPTSITATVFSNMNSSVASYIFDLVPSCDSTLRTSNGTIELNKNEGYCVYVGFRNQLGDYGINSLVSINSCTCGEETVDNDFAATILSSIVVPSMTTVAVNMTSVSIESVCTPPIPEESNRNDPALIAVVVLSCLLTVTFLCLIVFCVLCCCHCYITYKQFHEVELSASSPQDARQRYYVESMHMYETQP